MWATRGSLKTELRHVSLEFFHCIFSCLVHAYKDYISTCIFLLSLREMIQQRARCDFFHPLHQAACLMNFIGHEYLLSKTKVNPLTAPARKFSGLKSAHIIHASNSIFDGPIATLLSLLCILVEVLSRALAKRGGGGGWGWGGGEAVTISNLAPLLVVFRMTVRQARQ